MILIVFLFKTLMTELVKGCLVGIMLESVSLQSCNNDFQFQEGLTTLPKANPDAPQYCSPAVLLLIEGGYVEGM